MDIGYINMLNKYQCNDNLLYHEYKSECNDQGANEKLGKWYGQSPTYGCVMSPNVGLSESTCIL